CEVCVHIPGKKSNPYELLVCPWDAIEMVPTENAAVVMAQIGGPPEYIAENWDRLVGTAPNLAELRAATWSPGYLRWQSYLCPGARVCVLAPVLVR
ncbi:MAG: hypothetical protein MKZ95_05315, partial [Pirellulales bacterium]|nr:hypothetical protein [Pirellulales bacterium]